MIISIYKVKINPTPLSVQPQPQMKHPLQSFGNIPSSYLVTPQFVGDFGSLSQSGMVPGASLSSGLVQGGLSGLPNFKVGNLKCDSAN